MGKRSIVDIQICGERGAGVRRRWREVGGREEARQRYWKEGFGEGGMHR